MSYGHNKHINAIQRAQDADIHEHEGGNAFFWPFDHRFLKFKLKLKMSSDCIFKKYNCKKVFSSFFKSLQSNLIVDKLEIKRCKCTLPLFSPQSLAPHTSGPRDVPRCGALSLLQKDAALQGGMQQNPLQAERKIAHFGDWCVVRGASFFTP